MTEVLCMFISASGFLKFFFLVQKEVRQSELKPTKGPGQEALWGSDLLPRGTIC